jgi:hypothetical protein
LGFNNDPSTETAVRPETLKSDDDTCDEPMMAGLGDSRSTVCIFREIVMPMIR